MPLVQDLASNLGFVNMGSASRPNGLGEFPVGQSPPGWCPSAQAARFLPSCETRRASGGLLGLPLTWASKTAEAGI